MTSGVTGVFVNQCGMLVVTGVCVTEVCLVLLGLFVSLVLVCCHSNLCLVRGFASCHLDHFLFLFNFFLCSPLCQYIYG